MKRMWRGWKRRIFLRGAGMLAMILIVIIMTAATSHSVCAEEGEDPGTQETEKSQPKMTEEQLNDMQSQIRESILDEVDMKEINQLLKEIFPQEKVTFQDVLTALLDEKETISPKLIGEFITDTLFHVVKSNKSTLVYLLLVMIIAAVFTNFSEVFQNRQIAQTGFYLVYILLITVCLHSFQMTVQELTDSMETLNTFMSVLAPAYFICMALAVGSISSIAFYNLVLLLIFLVDMVILHFLLPLIHVCLMVQVLNFLSDEEYLSKFAELLQTIVGWGLKTLLALITGAGIVQGILNPSMDAVKRSAFTKGAEMIPGIGDVFGGVTDVVLGTAVLIKNGIGMAGVVLVIAICLVPILNMGILTLLYKGLAALVQPVSDKRIVEAVNSVGDGYHMLLKVVCTTAVLFMITIAVAAAATT